MITSAADITNQVAGKFGTTAQDLRSKDDRQALFNARCELVRRLSSERHLTSGQIGRFLGDRDGSTIRRMLNDELIKKGRYRATAAYRSSIALACKVVTPRPDLWTQSEDATLRTSWDHHDAADIANLIGRSECAVSTRARRIGLRAPAGRYINQRDDGNSQAWHPQQVIRMENLYQSGMEIIKIAKSVGRTAQAVRSKLIKMHDTSALGLQREVAPA